ncbi:MAG: hypothetical protein COB46_05305 [Rhodospirillaceae bacterium]|nr:MAG: hypothetical protein COB46_05305 [Rhodospirillaceae bacterium]
MENGTQKNSVLNIPTITDVWKTGKPSITEFDAAWSSSATTLTESDVLNALRESGISFEDAISAIKSTATKPNES